MRVSEGWWSSLLIEILVIITVYFFLDWIGVHTFVAAFIALAVGSSLWRWLGR